MEAGQRALRAASASRQRSLAQVAQTPGNCSTRSAGTWRKPCAQLHKAPKQRTRLLRATALRRRPASRTNRQQRQQPMPPGRLWACSFLHRPAMQPSWVEPISQSAETQKAQPIFGLHSRRPPTSPLRQMPTKSCLAGCRTPAGRKPGNPATSHRPGVPTKAAARRTPEASG